MWMCDDRKAKEPISTTRKEEKMQERERERGGAASSLLLLPQRRGLVCPLALSRQAAVCCSLYCFVQLWVPSPVYNVNRTATSSSFARKSKGTSGLKCRTTCISYNDNAIGRPFA